MKTPLLILLKVCVSIAVGYFLYTHLNWGQVYDVVLKISPFYLLLSMALLFLTTFGVAYRTKALLDSIHIGITFSTSMTLSVVGYGLNQLLPGVVGGDFYRGLALHQRNIPLSTGISVLLTDRLMGLLTLGIMCFVGGYLYFDLLKQSALGEVLSVAIIFLSGVSLGLFLMSFLPVDLFKRSFLKTIAPFHDGLSTLRKKPLFFIKALGGSFFIHICLVLCFWLVGLDLMEDLKFSHLLLVLPITFFLSALPLSFGGWGLRESAMILGLSLFGVSKEDALVLSMVFGGLQLLVAIPCLGYGILSKETLLLKKKKGAYDPS